MNKRQELETLINKFIEDVQNITGIEDSYITLFLHEVPQACFTDKAKEVTRGAQVGYSVRYKQEDISPYIHLFGNIAKAVEGGERP